MARCVLYRGVLRAEVPHFLVVWLDHPHPCRNKAARHGGAVTKAIGDLRVGIHSGYREVLDGPEFAGLSLFKRRKKNETPLEAQGRSLERGRRDGTGTKRERDWGRFDLM